MTSKRQVEEGGANAKACSTIIRLVMVLVLFAHAWGVTGNNYFERETEKRDALRFCGPHLANAIQVVCRGKYNTLNKKSRNPSIREELVDPDTELEDGVWHTNSALGDLPLPFRTKPMASALNPRAFRRVLRGAYDECCAKSCSMDELMTYCTS